MSKQSKRDLIDEVGLLMRRTQAMQDLFDEVAAERLGLNRTDLRLLDILDTEGPMPSGKLADINRLSRPAMSAALDRLERSGYARRVRGTEDRRQVIVEVTPKLAERVTEIWGPMAEAGDRIFGRFTAAELETVARFMRSALDVFPPNIERVAAMVERAGPSASAAQRRDTPSG